MENWFDVQQPDVQWLVHGLLSNNSNSCYCGKPKAGKSTAIRNLVAAVIKGRPYLGRTVNVPTEGGKVLYIHLDRKDPVPYVVRELRALGINEEEKNRLKLMDETDMPKAREERLPWVLGIVKDFKPNLIIFDLLFQFVHVSGSNGYNEILDELNKLQDALKSNGFEGHLCVAHHARKANSTDNPFDDMLGSSALSGSCATTIMFRYDRKNKVRTLQTDQSFKEESVGDIEETVVERNSFTGEIHLGQPVEQTRSSKNKEKQTKDADDVFQFICQHPGCTEKQIVDGLHIAKLNVRKYLDEIRSLVTRTGDGKSGRPFRYSANTEGVNL